MNPISSTTADLIEARVQWLDAEMEAVLLSASTDLRLYDWVRYHLGWTDEQLQPLSHADRRKHGGKRLRGVLTILACEAVGGPPEAAVAAGAAVEFVHNFSLVHDDVEDNDRERRHRPTVWTLWGIPHAINVGSNMQALVNASLLRLGMFHEPARVQAAFQAATRAIILMTEGQFLDMDAEDGDQVDLPAYFRIIGGKTSALTEGSLHLGALLGTENPAIVAHLAEFGREFGMAFQCRDDFLGMWGDPKQTGKPVASDLIQGKRSLPVVHGLVTFPAGSSAGEEYRRKLRDRDVPGTLAMLEEAGSAEFVNQRVSHHTELALQALVASGISGVAATGIREIAAFALGRSF